MIGRVLVSAAALATLSACQPADSSANDTAPVHASPVPEDPAPDARQTEVPPAKELADYIVGAWSFESECATDFSVHYYPDGKVENSGNVGTWRLEGDVITETITERFEMGGEPEQVNPPEVLRYTLARVDNGNAVLTLDGRKVPIKRC